MINIVEIGYVKVCDEYSELEINSEYSKMLNGIDYFSHLFIIYWAHKEGPRASERAEVHPLGNREFNKVGIFATHSPSRPNNILVTVVRFIGRNENILRVSGLDAFDGSPIIDIKPYFHEPMEDEVIRIPEWTKIVRDYKCGRTKSLKRAKDS
jgi:tRNA (adenine37-N6)-methyltransferase